MAICWLCIVQLQKEVKFNQKTANSVWPPRRPVKKDVKSKLTAK